jgi:hypothetical protein
MFEFFESLQSCSIDEPSLSDSSQNTQPEMLSDVAASDDCRDASILEWFRGFFEPEELLRKNDFTNNGEFDLRYNCIVEGDVQTDLQYVDLQTHGSCSLMAQEQFVERYLGKDVAESELEEFAKSLGVYTPDNGTNFAGQDVILDAFGIPHQRYLDANIETLDKAVASNQDAILNVDAREFYQDSTMPPGTGHAVAVVGRGVDPATGATSGFYFTDSNFPKTARFVSIDQLNTCWTHQMITVPATSSPVTA